MKWNSAVGVQEDLNGVVFKNERQVCDDLRDATPVAGVLLKPECKQAVFGVVSLDVWVGSQNLPFQVVYR